MLVDIWSLLPSPNTELQLPNSGNFVLDHDVICESNVLKLCLTLWASAVLEMAWDAVSSVYAAQHPEQFYCAFHSSLLFA